MCKFDGVTASIQGTEHTHTLFLIHHVPTHDWMSLTACNGGHQLPFPSPCLSLNMRRHNKITTDMGEEYGAAESR